MAIYSGAPSVTIREIDLSTRVPAFPGIYCAIVIPADRGPIDNAYLCTDESQFLKKFTLNERVEVHHDLSYFSVLAALQNSDKVWVRRAIGNNYKYGGRTVYRLGGSKFTESIASAEVDPATDVITTVNSWDTGAPVMFYLTSSDTGDVLPAGILSNTVYYVINVSGTSIKIANTVEDAQAGNAVDITSAGQGMYAMIYQDWYLGDANPDGHDFTNEPDALFSLHASDPGVWSNDIYYKLWIERKVETLDMSTDVDITNNQLTVTQNWVTGEPVRLYVSSNGAGDSLPYYDHDKDDPTGIVEGATEPVALANNGTYYVVNVDDTTIKLASTIDNALAGNTLDFTSIGQGTMKIEPIHEIKEPGSFLIEIYKKGNFNTPVESFTCSRVEGAKDGNNRNIYIETTFDSSKYVRVVDNLTADESLIPSPQPFPVNLIGGADGDAVTDGKMMLAADYFSNPENVPVTLLLDAGWTTPAYQKHLIGIAESRQDCVAILSVPYENENSADYLNKIVGYRRNELNANTSFAALYSSHLQIYDKYNDRKIYVSPDGYVAARISYTAANFEMWYPVGGDMRGVLNVLDTKVHFTKGEMDYLYNSGVNPIRYTPGKGIRIWGQKTLLSRPSSLDRLNVRLLLVVIEPAIKESLESNLFDLGDDATYSLVRTRIENYMLGIKARRGVYDFLVVCDSSINTPEDKDNHVMNVQLFVKPTQSIEYIPFTVIITPTGLEFSIAAESI